MFWHQPWHFDVNVIALTISLFREYLVFHSSSNICMCMGICVNVLVSVYSNFVVFFFFFIKKDFFFPFFILKIYNWIKTIDAIKCLSDYFLLHFKGFFLCYFMALVRPYIFVFLLFFVLNSWQFVRFNKN